MMRRQSCLCAPTILILATLGLTAPLSTTQASQVLNNTHLEQSAQTVTAEGRVRVIITKNKPKLHLARQQRPVVLLALNDDDTDYYDEQPELQVGYRRPELIDQSADVELSDEIKLRLALARMKAMQAYNRNWS